MLKMVNAHVYMCIHFLFFSVNNTHSEYCKYTNIITIIIKQLTVPLQGIQKQVKAVYQRTNIVCTHYNHLTEMVLMSTHDISFHREMLLYTKLKHELLQ